jgi:hypothetical protein
VCVIWKHSQWGGIGQSLAAAALKEKTAFSRGQKKHHVVPHFVFSSFFCYSLFLTFRTVYSNIANL